MTVFSTEMSLITVQLTSTAGWLHWIESKHYCIPFRRIAHQSVKIGKCSNTEIPAHATGLNVFGTSSFVSAIGRYLDVLVLRDGNECWLTFKKMRERVINLSDAAGMMWKEALKVSRCQYFHYITAGTGSPVVEDNASAGKRSSDTFVRYCYIIQSRSALFMRGLTSVKRTAVCLSVRQSIECMW